jgi:hypothetical protein
MPTIWNWIGSAAPVAQKDVRIPAAVNIGNDFSVTRNGKTVTYRALAATAADVTAGLAAAFNASIIPEFRDALAADLVGTISFTAVTPGKPFPFVYSAAVGTGGGAPTFAASGVQTASAGPYHWDSAGNWRDAAGNFGVPATLDTCIFEDNDVPCLYGLNQSAVTLALLDFRETYGAANGFVGLPRYNPSGYQEDRDTYLRIGATILRNRSVSRRIKVDTGAIQTDANCSRTGSPIENNVPAFLLKGTHVANTFQITRGYAGLGFYAGEAATFADVNIGFQSSRDSDANLWIGPNVTLSGTIDKSGGNLYVKAALVTFSQEAGNTVLEGDGLNVTTLKGTGGKFTYASNGTIATLRGYDDLVLDFTGDLRAANVTDAEWYGNLANIIDEWTRVIWGSGGIKARGSNPLHMGESITLQVTKL